MDRDAAVATSTPKSRQPFGGLEDVNEADCARVFEREGGVKAEDADYGIDVLLEGLNGRRLVGREDEERGGELLGLEEWFQVPHFRR